MKKFLLLLSVVLVSTLSAGADTVAPTTEPLLLAPLNTVLSSSPSVYEETTKTGEFKTPIGGGVYEATYTPATAVNYAENMIPQNAAAKGEPVPVKREPRVRIQTKQRSQGNAYWNPGGKGTKSFF